MAQKSNAPASSDVRSKAQAMRLEQQRADARMRNIIIAVVTTVVLAVSGVVAWVVMTSEELEANLGNVDVKEAFGAYAGGAPIILSHKGFGVADEALPTLTESFDYSCPACTVAAVSFGHPLFEDMRQGKYNLEIRPVASHNAPWNAAATSASLMVANKEPEKWEAFHDALMLYAFEESQAHRGSTVNNLSASAKQVKVVAQNVGVSQKVIDQFPANAVDDYLAKSSQSWQQMSVEGRESLGTPEFVANVKGKMTKVNLTSFEPDQAAKEIRTALGIK